MRIGEGGVFIYDTVEELSYNLMNAIGMSVNPDGSVVDSDISTGVIYGRKVGLPITFGGKVIKVTINPNDVKYAGEDEIAFDPLNNVKMITTILGFYLDKIRVFDQREITSYYPTENVDPNGDKVFAMSVKFADGEEVNSNFFYNKCLAIEDLIFKLAEMNVDLYNFNIPRSAT